MEKPNGYVYILTNPSFREDWVKIGKSSRPVDVRSKELDNTAVPLPFEIYATLKTSKFDKVEKQIHKQIDRLTDLRIRQNREFFNIAPSVVFDELNLPVTVASDDKVEYQGRLWSLSAFTREFLPEEKQNTSGAYQGPKYFSYKGKTLSELRKEKEF